VVKVTITWGHLNRREGKPTISEALAMKLGREPTHAELVAEVKRILSEARP